MLEYHRQKTLPPWTCALVWLLAVACVSKTEQVAQEPPPRWLLNLEEVYPGDSFMAALGEGNSLSEAQQIAAGNLAASFRARVSSKSEAGRSFTSSGSGADEVSSRSSRSSQQVATEADETLLGVSYNTPYQRSDGRVVIVAYLDRDKVGRIYRQKIEDTSSRITQLLEQTQQPSTGQLFGYTLVHRAYSLALDNQKLLDQLALINPTQRRFAQPKYDLAQLEQLRSDRLRSLSFTVELTNDETLLSGVEQLVVQSLQDLGLPRATDDDAVLKVKGELTLRSVGLDNGYKNLFWQIKMDVVDDQGKVVVGYSDEGRESGRTLERAKLSLLKYLKKRVNSQVADKLLEYFNGSNP